MTRPTDSSASTLAASAHTDQFARAHLPAGYGAPFEVRELELNDQGRMAPIESRTRGARF